MKAMIIYADKRGKCKKMALALEQHFQIPAVSVKEIAAVEPLDLLLVVGGGDLSGEDQAGIEPLLKNMHTGSVKYAILISLQAFSVRSSLVKGHGNFQPHVKRILEEKNVQLLEECACCSQYGVLGIGHPSRGDIEHLTKRIDAVIRSEKSLQ